MRILSFVLGLVTTGLVSFGLWWYYAPPLNPSPLCQELAYRLDHASEWESMGLGAFSDGDVTVSGLQYRLLDPDWKVKDDKLTETSLRGSEWRWLNHKAKNLFAAKVKRQTEEREKRERENAEYSAKQLCEMLRQPKEKDGKKCSHCDKTDDRDPRCNVEPTIHIQSCDRIKNMRGSDGGGICVMACLETAARHQGIVSLHGLTELESKKPGGHWPAKVDKVLKHYQKAGTSTFTYQQFESKDRREIADHIREAIHAGQVPSCSYGAANFVNVLQLDTANTSPARACVLDPNERAKVRWLFRDEFLDQATANGYAWIITLAKK